MATAREWLEGARLRTLPASISPVVAGTAVAWFAGPQWSVRAVLAPLLCLVVGLGLQIGSNYANDYSDGVRGTDAYRVGPMRLVGSGVARPAAVKRAAWTGFAVAGLAGLVLVVWTAVALGPGGWVAPAVIVAVGLAAIVAAWYYTGGRRPYGYAGWGEVFVFVFFGLVAGLGTTYLVATAAASAVPWGAGLVSAVVMGLMSTAILVANNLRDLETDRQAGKLTLPARLGERGTRWLYAGLLVGVVPGVAGLAWVTTPWALLGLAGLGLVAAPVIRVVRGDSGRPLIGVLKMTGLAELAVAVLIAAGIGLGRLA